MVGYRDALEAKIESKKGNPEWVLKYLSEEYDRLRHQDHYTAEHRKTVRQVRHGYLESVNGKFDKKEIRRLTRKYPIHFTD